MKWHCFIRSGTVGCLAVALMLAAIAVQSVASERHSAVKFSRAELQEIVSDHIESHMPWEPGSARVEFLSQVNDVILEGRDIGFRVDARRNENYIGQTSFSVRFFDGGTYLADQSVRVRIEVAKDFVVTSRNLGDGSLITDSDVMLVQRWVDRVPRNRIADTEQVRGKMVRGSIAQNTELQERMLRNPQVVRRGEVVRVVLSRGGLHMETLGVSVEAGALGDLIRIRNTSSNSLFYARVVDESVVRVDF
ncbi:MAG: flagellar basal body P-ring formation chaperone FlgA [Syntrophales bacterium]|nr:flagellar basal body P-ring formation chaperone FlgA [Syntrophales bacterium]